MGDSTGKCAFEYIRDYEEWIQSGNFSPDIISVMRSKLTVLMLNIIALHRQIPAMEIISISSF